MPAKTLPKLTARIHKEGGRVYVTSPSVGLWREGPPVGTLVGPGMSLGALEILGVVHPVVAPPGAHGVVVERTQPDLSRVPAGYGTPLLVLDPEVSGRAQDAEAEDTTAAADGLVFRTPMSGRFYRRPAPDKPNFVTEGQIIETGHTVALLEVMKTFNRIAYGGDGLPDRAKVVRVVPEDGADLDARDPILQVEPAE